MKKLHISVKDVWIFGVCAGIAETYGFKVDIVRLIFFFSLFLGSSGFWVYLALTILLSKSNKDDAIDNAVIEIDSETEKDKIIRPWDNRILGGVCAGISRYFAWDVTLVRLVFVGMTIIGGIGAILYLFFWFLFPSEE